MRRLRFCILQKKDPGSQAFCRKYVSEADAD